MDSEVVEEGPEEVDSEGAGEVLKEAGESLTDIVEVTKGGCFICWKYLIYQSFKESFFFKEKI